MWATPGMGAFPRLVRKSYVLSAWASSQFGKWGSGEWNFCLHPRGLGACFFHEEFLCSESCESMFARNLFGWGSRNGREEIRNLWRVGKSTFQFEQRAGLLGWADKRSNEKCGTWTHHPSYAYFLEGIWKVLRKLALVPNSSPWRLR